MTWITAFLLAAFYAADFPLALAKSGSNQVELRNTGTQPINAWAFAITSPNASGGIHRVFHSADVYLSEVTGGLQGAAPHLQRLMPGGTRTVPTDPMPADASLQVIAVVLDDDTAMGDDATIAQFFEKRVAERDALKRVVDTFNSVLAQKHGAEALDVLKQRFAGDEAIPVRSARDAVTAWADKAKTASAEDVDRSMQTYVQFVTRQYEVAAKHAVRKNRG
jgi:hypothetical protein